MGIEKLQCRSCGGNLTLDNGIYVCRYCGTHYTSTNAPTYRNPQLDNTVIINDYSPDKVSKLASEFRSFCWNRRY
jgi:hypothetical protein